MKTRINAIPPAAALCCLLASPAGAQDARDDEHHDIEEIIVTAVPIERAVEQLAQPTSVVEGDALAKKQSASLGETLANEPGVNSTYFGPVAARPVIRGQYGERVRVLANGLDALDASALSEDHAVSVDSILAERVEIVRGPATLLYGSGAAGGLVNVVDSRIHEKPLGEPFSGAVALGSDSATGKESAALKFDAALGPFIAHADWFRRDTDDVKIPGFAESAVLRELEHGEEEEGEEEEEAFGVVENTDSEVEGGAFALTVAGDSSYAGLSVNRYLSNYGVPGVHAHGEEEEGGDEEEESIRIDLEQTRYDLEGGVELDGILERVKFHVTRNEYRHVELEGTETGTVFDTQGTDSRLELRHRRIGDFEGAVGLQYKAIDFDAIGDEAFVPPSDTEQLSVFAFEEWAVKRDWVLQGSARIERQEIKTPGLEGYEDTAFGASIGAIWAFADDTSLAANLALTERHPNSTELYSAGPHLAVQRFERGSVTQDGTLLDKEFSTNLDLTLRGDLDRVEWSVTGFYNDVADYILLSPTGETEDGLPVFDYRQRDAELYGVEAEALVDLIDAPTAHVHARFFSDYVHGEESVSGAYLPRLPPLRYGASLHYARGGFEAGIEAIYNERQDKVAAGELPTASFTMWNAEASYRFESPDVLVFLKGTNLGDEDARRHSSPLKDFVPLPERSIQAGFRIDF